MTDVAVSAGPSFDGFGGSLTFAAAHDPDAVQWARESAAGGLMLDLEDVVPETQKDSARRLAVAELTAGFGLPVALRTNGIDTVHWTKDIQAVVPCRPQAIIVPKLCTPEEYVRAHEDITEVERGAGIELGSTPVLLLVETCGAVLRLDAMVAATPRTTGLIFGGEDLMGELGVSASVGGAEVAFARGMIVHAAKASGLFAVDRAWLDLDDDDGYRADTLAGRSLGFDGRFSNSDRQIELANALYAPTEQELDYARLVLSALREAEQEGKASLVRDGKFIDTASLRRVKAIAARAKRVGVDL